MAAIVSEKAMCVEVNLKIEINTGGEGEKNGKWLKTKTLN